MRAVLDVNVLVSALISPAGVPGRVLRRWASEDFELVVSETLLGELGEVLARPTVRGRVTEQEAARLLTTLRQEATLVSDPDPVPARCADPDDDYLIALAEAANAHLVSGDSHLLALRDELPIRTPREFLELLR